MGVHVRRIRLQGCCHWPHQRAPVRLSHNLHQSTLGKWRLGVQLTVLLLVFPVCYKLLVFFPQEVVIDLTMLSPDVEEDLFNTFVIAIVVSCVVLLRGLVRLRLFELINCLLLGLQNSGFPGGGLAESFLSCLDFFL